MDRKDQESLPDNYTSDEKSGRCVHRDVSKDYGNIPAECQYCVHRPLYTTDCDIEKNLQSSDDICEAPTLDDFKKWRELGEELVADFDLKTARECFVREYVSRRASEAREKFYFKLLRIVSGRLAADSRSLIRFACWCCHGGPKK